MCFDGKPRSRNAPTDSATTAASPCRRSVAPGKRLPRHCVCYYLRSTRKRGGNSRASPRVKPSKPHLAGAPQTKPRVDVQGCAYNSIRVKQHSSRRRGLSCKMIIYRDDRAGADGWTPGRGGRHTGPLRGQRAYPESGVTHVARAYYCTASCSVLLHEAMYSVRIVSNSRQSYR